MRTTYQSFIDTRVYSEISKAPGCIYTFSGPAGSGKTSILDSFMHNPRAEHMSVSIVPNLKTRPPRSTETDTCSDSQFIPLESFQQLKQEKKLLRWMWMDGHWYGQTKHSIFEALQEGKILIWQLAPDVALKLKRTYPNKVTTIFVTPSFSYELAILKHRLTQRGQNDAASVQERLALARTMLGLRSQFDVVLLNDNGTVDLNASLLSTVLNGTYRYFSKIPTHRRLMQTLTSQLSPLKLLFSQNVPS
jgi:guanylate kinase